MNMIAAVDKNWAIGNKNQLLISIPADMKMFRKETVGNVVVMGRKTLESFPNQKPLPHRTNIVLSRNKNYRVEGAKVVSSIEELLEELKQYDSSRIYVIGGETIYREMLPYVDTCYITKIDHAYEADAYFPNLDQNDSFKLAAESEEQVYFDITYTFLKYQRQ